LELRKFQKNEIAETIQKNNYFQHKDFSWESVVFDDYDEEKYSRLDFGSTDFYFTFRIKGELGDIYYSPGKIKIYIYKEKLDWNERKTEFRNWLYFIEREIEEPDLWEEYVNQEFSSESRTITDLSNEKFTEPEIEKIVEGTHKIKAYIKDQDLADDEQMEYVEKQIDYLVDSSKRLGRKDWIHICLSVLNGIFINLALQPENKTFIINTMKQALSGVKGFLGI